MMEGMKSMMGKMMSGVMKPDDRQNRKEHLRIGLHQK